MIIFNSNAFIPATFIYNHGSENSMYVKYLLKILNVICIVDTLLKTLKPSGYLHEAIGINCEVCKKGPYVKCSGKYYYWCYLNINLFMLALPVIHEKRLNISYPNF